MSSDERGELSVMIDQYRHQMLPLVVPVTALRHYVYKLQVPSLLDQVDLTPQPHELMLLNQL